MSESYQLSTVPLSGFGYPLSVFVLPDPASHFSDSSVLGISPSEFFSLQRSVPFSRSLLSCFSFETCNLSATRSELRFRASFPLQSHSRRNHCYITTGAAPLLGSRVFEVFSLPTLATISDHQLFCTFLRIDKNSYRHFIVLRCWKSR
jgi:hypothetical protein